MFGKKSETLQKELLLSTTMTLQRPYEELGLTFTSIWPGRVERGDKRMKELHKETLEAYPDADAVIGIIVYNGPTIGGLGHGLIGTAVRYKD
jgi:hypothetical protein